MHSVSKYLTILFCIVLLACSEAEDPVGEVRLLSASLNGNPLTSGDQLQEVSVDASFIFTFSGGIDSDRFNNHFRLTQNGAEVNYETRFANESSRVTVQPELEAGLTYELNLAAASIGINNGMLDEAFSSQFTTVESNASQQPCTSASGNCFQELTLANDNNQSASFGFYRSYPVYDKTEVTWDQLEQVVLVMHGINRNAGEYFSWMNSSVSGEGALGRTLVIAPRFVVEDEAESGNYFWERTGWRDGANSVNEVSISSFAIIDQLLEPLANTNKFPNLNRVLITGHSSGGLFTHVYAAANVAQQENPGWNWQYLPSNSQYYYYPDGRRLQENSENLYTPSNCSGYNFWPLGFRITPEYVSQLERETVNRQFLERNITYLLGNGNQPDPTLNTEDCSATLLGSTRFQRGVNMFNYLMEAYPNANHQFLEVDGIGHDGEGIFTSQTFRTWFTTEFDAGE